MNAEQHKLFLQSIKDSQEQSQRVIDKINATLLGVRETINDIQETNNKYDKLKEDYGKVMEKLAIKISGTFQHPLKASSESDPRQRPTPIPMKQAVENMMYHEQILFITGAGVSVQSGIPTFRGFNGLYDKKFNFNGVQMDPEQFISRQFFNQHPEPIWQWIQSINQMVKSSKPNRNHILIHDILCALAAKGKKAVLVTQNIDDFHIKPANKQYEYHPIHGVANQMRCRSLHYRPYSPAQTSSKCPECQQTMRPHVMFFDESYGVPFGEHIKNREFDFVVVIGSSLSTGMCIKLVSDACEVIQINPGPVIEVGNVHPFKDETHKVLEQMLNCVRNYKQTS